MEKSISPWQQNQDQNQEFDDFNMSTLNLNKQESKDYTQQNKVTLTLNDQVDLLIKQHKEQMDSIYAPKKKKKLQVNSSKARGEIKLIKYLCSKYGWKEVFNDGDVLWSGLSVQDLDLCQEIRVNRFPEMHELTHKKTTGFYLNKFREYFPDKYDFFPRTFLIPEDIQEFKKFSQKNKNMLYIAKPSSGSQGDGIKVFRNFKDLPISQYTPQGNEMIVQQYIHEPLLLDNKKFDFRLYVMICSTDPLIVYINDEGLVRFCAEDYEVPNTENFKNSYMHLTNYSLNKDHKDFKLPQDGDDILGQNNASKRTFTSVLKDIAKLGFDIEQIKQDINETISKFIISMNPFILYNHKTAFKNKKSKCFQVLGFDIMLDKKGRPWLIEANSNPSFNIEHEAYDQQYNTQNILSPLDKYIKAVVVGDAMMLSQKSIQKHNDIGLEGQYRSWQQIINQDADQDQETMVIANMLKVYGKLSGFRFKYSLTSGSFRKLADYIHSPFLKKVDYELIFKKFVTLNNSMDFYDFIQTFEYITEKVYFNEYEEENKIVYINKLLDSIIEQF